MSKLPAGFEDFKKAKSQVFAVNGTGYLTVKASCAVAIVEGSRHEISVQIDAAKNDLSNIKLTQDGDEISVVQEKSFANGSGNVVIQGGGNSQTIFMGNWNNFSGGNVVISGLSGRSISMIGGRIIIDGKEVKPEQEDDDDCKLNRGKNDQRAESNKPPRILIKAPACSCLNAQLSGIGSLVSDVVHFDTSLKLRDSSSAQLSTQVLYLETEDAAKFVGEVKSGALIAKASDASKIKIEGTFASVQAKVSDASSLTTMGDVAGDYEAKASDASRIVHRGNVRGRVKERSSDAASIHI